MFRQMPFDYCHNVIESSLSSDFPLSSAHISSVMKKKRNSSAPATELRLFCIRQAKTEKKNHFQDQTETKIFDIAYASLRIGQLSFESPFHVDFETVMYARNVRWEYLRLQQNVASPGKGSWQHKACAVG